MMAAAVSDEGKAVASAQALWLQDKPLDAISQYQQIWRRRINLNLGPVSRSAPSNSEFHQFGPLLIETLAQLYAGGVHAFAHAGTLLGLVRGKSLLPYDKDLDVGMPFEEFAVARAVLLANGWEEAPTTLNFIAPISLRHRDRGVVLDLCGFRRDKATGALLSGMWIKGWPDRWQRLTRFDDIALEPASSPYGPFWRLKSPETLLAAMYGPDWRIPDPDFDTVVSIRNLVSPNALTSCFAYHRTLEHMQQARWSKALSNIRTMRGWDARGQSEFRLLRDAESYVRRWMEEVAS